MSKDISPNTAEKAVRRSGAAKWIALGSVAVALAAVAIVAYVMFFRQAPAENTLTTPSQAPNAQIGIMPGKTDEQIEEILTQKIDENSVAFSINSNVTFETGTSAGDLMMESPANNINYIEFVIRRNDTGEVLYRSGLLQPNQYILEDKLQVKPALTKGTYPCTADITLYDKETMETRGMVQAALTISVIK